MKQQESNSGLNDSNAMLYHLSHMKKGVFGIVQTNQAVSGRKHS